MSRRLSATPAPVICAPPAEPTTCPVSARKISGTATMVAISRRNCSVVKSASSAPACRPISTVSIKPPGVAPKNAASLVSPPAR